MELGMGSSPVRTGKFQQIRIESGNLLGEIRDQLEVTAYTAHLHDFSRYFTVA